FSTPNIFFPTIAFGISSIIIGTIVATIFSRIPLKPVNTIINGMNKLASGDYKTRIDLGHIPISLEISNSFNTLACELENTEMLRSDFVNNFSHEFKTPIVSICGFAKLLQKESITKEQQKEYLDIIVEESTRLSEMATKVLNLTKVENQNILTDITCFNLSEQIRNCILILENKWSKKGLTIVADFDEYMTDACEELLKQVWINLVDNAIKFSPENGEIHIVITKLTDKITVSIKNNGPEMSEEEITRIFDKFWQGDTSHTSEGNGIGLSIARRIVQLHKGTISVES
ncbi:HAMP domain-containing sensor histidine kinase, partial [Anaerosporobacter sp.]